MADQDAMSLSGMLLNSDRAAERSSCRAKQVIMVFDVTTFLWGISSNTARASVRREHLEYISIMEEATKTSEEKGDRRAREWSDRARPGRERAAQDLVAEGRVRSQTGIE